VEVVNTDLGIYSKSGSLLSRVPLASLCSSDCTLSFTDPQVTYDEHAGQFFVGALAKCVLSLCAARKLLDTPPAHSGSA